MRCQLVWNAFDKRFNEFKTSFFFVREPKLVCKLLGQQCESLSTYWWNEYALNTFWKFYILLPRLFEISLRTHMITNLGFLWSQRECFFKIRWTIFLTTLKNNFLYNLKASSSRRTPLEIFRFFVISSVRFGSIEPDFKMKWI